MSDAGTVRFDRADPRFAEAQRLMFRGMRAAAQNHQARAERYAADAEGLLGRLMREAARRGAKLDFRVRRTAPSSRQEAS